MTKRELLLNVTRARGIKYLASEQYEAACALAHEAGCQSHEIANAANAALPPTSEQRR